MKNAYELYCERLLRDFEPDNDIWRMRRLCDKLIKANERDASNPYPVALCDELRAMEIDEKERRIAYRIATIESIEAELKAKTQ